MQGINIAAIAYTARIITHTAPRRNMVPHFSVTNINSVNPEKLKEAGFKGIVWDKDNTITEPYQSSPAEDVALKFLYFKEVFGPENMVIMSNSAGTRDDPEYRMALEIENNLDIRVVRHPTWKKPAGIKYVESMLPCERYEIVMIGDRVLTDVVFGNIHEMLTIHSALLTEEGDNPTAAKIREKELPRMEKLYLQGVRAPEHRLYRPDLCDENLLEDILRKHKS
jgi:phosphatidylglycerophosphatase GEP4